MGKIFTSYKKEGPGVRENAPQKKRFFQFWDIFGRKFWNMLTLNLLFIICCIPIITIGPAVSGLVYVTRNYVNGVPVMLKEDFFGAFKRGWKISFVVSVLNFLLIGIGSYSSYFYFCQFNITDSVVYFIGFVLSLSALAIVLFMNFYIHIMIVTFDLSFKKLIKNSFILAGIGLVPNICSLISLAIIVGIICAVWFLSPYIAMPLALFTVAPISCLIVVFNAFPLIKKHIIDPFYKDNNLENPLEKELNKESVFKDRF